MSISHNLCALVLAAVLWVAIRCSISVTATTANECICCCYCGTVLANWPAVLFLSYSCDKGTYPYSPNPIQLNLITTSTSIPDRGSYFGQDPIGPGDCNNVTYLSELFIIADPFGNNYAYRFWLTLEPSGTIEPDLVPCVNGAGISYPNFGHVDLLYLGGGFVDCATFSVISGSTTTWNFIVNDATATETTFFLST